MIIRGNKSHFRLGKIIVAGLFIPFFIAACTSSRSLPVRLFDQNGAPIGGGLFYAEAFQMRGGVFDFAWGESDAEGYVRQRDGDTLRIAWKSNARLSFAAFAPGRTPEAFIDLLGRATDSAFDVVLRDTAQTDLDWQPVLGNLEFPFENKPGLAARLKDSTNFKLLRTFMHAYEVFKATRLPSTPEELKKIEFMKKLYDDIVNE